MWLNRERSETRFTVDTHRQCAAYPPGLGVNSKEEKEGRDGAAKDDKIKKGKY